MHQYICQGQSSAVTRRITYQASSIVTVAAPAVKSYEEYFKPQLSELNKQALQALLETDKTDSARNWEGTSHCLGGKVGVLVIFCRWISMTDG